MSTASEFVGQEGSPRCQNEGVAPRFLTLADVAEILSISSSQAYALVRSGELRGIKIGGRGQWRVETTELELFIERMYAETDAYVRSNPVALDVD